MKDAVKAKEERRYSFEEYVAHFTPKDIDIDLDEQDASPEPEEIGREMAETVLRELTKHQSK